MDWEASPNVEAAMLQFVPMTDDVLYREQDLPGPLVPYRCGVPCWHELRGERDDAPPPRTAEPLVSD